MAPRRRCDGAATLLRRRCDAAAMARIARERKRSPRPNRSRYGRVGGSGSDQDQFSDDGLIGFSDDGVEMI